MPETAIPPSCPLCGTQDKTKHHQGCPEYNDDKCIQPVWVHFRMEKIKKYCEGWSFGYMGVGRFYLQALNNPTFALGYEKGLAANQQYKPLEK